MKNSSSGGESAKNRLRKAAVREKIVCKQEKPWPGATGNGGCGEISKAAGLKGMQGEGELSREEGKGKIAKPAIVLKKRIKSQQRKGREARTL